MYKMWMFIRILVRILPIATSAYPHIRILPPAFLLLEVKVPIGNWELLLPEHSFRGEKVLGNIHSRDSQFAFAVAKIHLLMIITVIE